jgi:broad specificity phosphatase PhoE
VTTLLLVRHGRTAWNADGRFQGQADPPLDHVGREQAATVAVAVAVAVGLAPRRPVLAVASDLRRARQTGAVIASRCGIPLVTTSALREVGLGRWEGLSRAEAAEQFPDEYAAFVADPAALGLRRGGGETLAEAGRRVANALLAVAAVCGPGGDAVVVSHGLALQAAMAALAESGVIALTGDPPHLANGECLAVTLLTPPEDPHPHHTRSYLTASTQASVRE